MSDPEVPEPIVLPPILPGYVASAEDLVDVLEKWRGENPDLAKTPHTIGLQVGVDPENYSTGFLITFQKEW